MISRETAKQESSSPSDKAAEASSWSRLKDPRIVRVSRAFGGKDRHSKVCTVRGLRDRRVRLSVPTAIQLYDLQDRLGLNQPSKVVDWLLNAAKTEIDELPPLQFPQGGTFLSMLDNINQDKSKNVSSQTQERDDNWARSSLTHHSYVNQNPSSLLMNTSSSTSIPFNSFVRWDPSNLTLSHPPRSPNCSPPHQQPEDWHNFSLMAPLQPHHHHQVPVYQPAAGIAAAAAQPYFQSQISAPNAEFDMKQMNSYQTSSSPTVDESSTHFNMTANLLPSQNNDGGR